MKNLRVFYDDNNDILYIAKEGEEEEIIEISPGVNLELDKNGDLIGIELFNASNLFKDVIKLMEARLQAA
jgi:uncharacterized protein YuzE